jgi:hypothetical protein
MIAASHIKLAITATSKDESSLRPGDFNETYVPATYGESYQAVKVKINRGGG